MPERGRKELDVEFFNAADLSGKSTNILTRLKMAEAFDSIESINNLEVFCVYSNQKAGMYIEKIFKDIDTDLNKFYLPGYKNEGISRGIFYRIYKAVFLNSLLNLIYLFKLLRGSEDSIKYFWGWSADSLIGVIIYSFLKDGELILEFDDAKICDNELKKLIYIKAAEQATKVITVSNRTKNDLKQAGINEDKIKLLPNAVDPNEYIIEKDRHEIRKEIDLDTESFIVGYTGHLYDYKGIDKLIEVAQELEYEDLKIVIVGGFDKYIEIYRDKVIDRNLTGAVEVKGYVERHKVPLYQKAADVLVIPNEAQKNNLDYYTSPVKLREYFFSKNPVVASKLPAIEDHFSEDELFFFDPKHPQELAEKIGYIKENSEEAEKRSEKAFQKVKEYTWTKRALEILDL